MATKTVDYVTLDLDEVELEVLKGMLKGNNGRAPMGKIEEAIAKYQSARLADSPEPQLRLTVEQAERLEKSVRASMGVFARAFAVDGRAEDGKVAMNYLKLWGKLLVSAHLLWT